MRHSSNYYVRKSHRYLGLFIGIQFLLWTIGGFYFSWMSIKEIRGENLVNVAAEPLPASDRLVSPAVGLRKIQDQFGTREIGKIGLVGVLGKPYYEIAAADEQGNAQAFLVDAESGELREKFSKDEAVAIVRAALNQDSQLTAVDYLTADSVGSDHEYRGQPLPAWVVRFGTPKEFAVYVAADTGKIAAVRTRNWRIFDFLWMLHTMDYKGRDDINNYILRAFSILGLLTISSGFVLFVISSPYLRRRRWLKR